MARPDQSIATLISYMRTFITVGYYILLIPFKIVPSKKASILVSIRKSTDESIGFRFHTNIFQKILCGMAYAGVLCHQALILVRPEVKGMFSSSSGVLSYIGIVDRFLGFAYLVCATIVFWKQKRHFMTIFKTVQKLPYATTRNGKRSLLLIQMGFIFIYGWNLYGIPFRFLNDFNDDFEITLTANTTVALNRVYSKSQLLLAFNPSSGTVSFGTITITQILIAFVYSIMYVFTELLQIGVEMLVLVGIVYMWHTTRLFEQWYKKLDLNDDSKYDILKQALQEYHILKILVRTTNKVLGPPIVLVITFLLPFYATFAGLAMSSKNSLDNHPKFLLGIHYAIYFIELLMSAEVNRKGKDFVRWISSPHFIDTMSSRQLTSLSMDVNSNQLALKGCGFFSLTYRFLTSVIGAFLTYSVIVIQFRRNDGP